MVRADDVAEAEVQTVTTQSAQASRQPVDLHVAFHRRLAPAAGRHALGIEAIGELGDGLLEALRDGREVQLVRGDQRRVSLCAEAVGKVKHAGSQGVHGISSDLIGDLDRISALPKADSGLGQRFCGTTRVLPQAPRCAIR